LQADTYSRAKIEMSARYMLSMLKISTGLFLLCIFVTPYAVADAPLEAKVAELSKTYANGDSVRISCRSANAGLCKMFVSVGGVRKSINVDFREIGVLPSFDLVRMVGSGKPFFISVTTGYHCRKLEEELLGSQVVGASCRVYFDVGGDNKVVWSGSEIIPTQESIYADPGLISK
jgi:hypothetical protein